MTKNKRYESTYDRLNDQRILQATAQLAPCTLPQRAYGLEPIQWQRGRAPEVWAWIIWRDAPATKIPAVAAGWNDRVVIVDGKRPVADAASSCGATQ